MHPVLQSVQNRFHDLLGPMDAEETQVHPSGNNLRWTTQQVVEHLILTYQSSSRVLADRLQKRRPTLTRCSPLQWWLQLLLLSFGQMPKGAPAPSHTVPSDASPALSGHDLAAKLAEEAAKMDALLDRCREKFGLQRVATHIVLGPLRVDQWRRFHVLHGLHHLKQIEQIRAEMPMRIITKAERRPVLGTRVSGA